MRAISLWQPWATAVATGVKRVETRHWPTSYRGPIAIHAAHHWDRRQKEFAMTERGLGRLPTRIPFGCIVAVAVLTACRSAEEVALEVSAIERLYGDYSAGRFAWMLAEARALPEPIPFKGRQSFFDVPDWLIAEALPA